MLTTYTHRLTPKQADFAAAYVLCGNASEAYRQAYDVGDKTKPSTV
jgi:phage terminase small subunit